MTNNRPDQARREALKRIERSARNFWLLLVGGFGVELLLIWGFIQLADFTDRIQVLIFWSMLSVFTLIILSLTVLSAHVSRQVQLLLKAIEVVGRRDSISQR